MLGSLKIYKPESIKQMDLLEGTRATKQELEDKGWFKIDAIGTVITIMKKGEHRIIWDNETCYVIRHYEMDSRDSPIKRLQEDSV